MSDLHRELATLRLSPEDIAEGLRRAEREEEEKRRRGGCTKGGRVQAGVRVARFGAGRQPGGYLWGVCSVAACGLHQSWCSLRHAGPHRPGLLHRPLAPVQRWRGSGRLWEATRPRRRRLPNPGLPGAAGWAGAVAEDAAAAATPSRAAVAAAGAAGAEAGATHLQARPPTTACTQRAPPPRLLRLPTCPVWQMAAQQFWCLRAKQRPGQTWPRGEAEAAEAAAVAGTGAEAGAARLSTPPQQGLPMGITAQVSRVLPPASSLPRPAQPQPACTSGRHPLPGRPTAAALPAWRQRLQRGSEQLRLHPRQVLPADAAGVAAPALGTLPLAVQGEPPTTEAGAAVAAVARMKAAMPQLAPPPPTRGLS